MATAARRALEAQSLAQRLPPLLAAARRVAATVAQGSHGRRRTGPGDSFWQFRPHQPSDGRHGIDWRRSARSDRLFVRETEWVAAQTVWLWRDRSDSMRWASAPGLPDKGERADVLLLALACLLLQAGERVGLLQAGGLPLSGHGALERLAVQVLLPPADAQALVLPSSGSTLVMVGDFLDPPDDLAAAIRRLSPAGGGGHLLQVLDPAEESLPYAGRVLFQDPEGGASLELTRVQDVRAAYAGRLAAQRAALTALAHGRGWSFSTHRTDQPPVPALLAVHAALGRQGGAP